MSLRRYEPASVQNESSKVTAFQVTGESFLAVTAPNFKSNAVINLLTTTNYY